MSEQTYHFDLDRATLTGRWLGRPDLALLAVLLAGSWSLGCGERKAEPIQEDVTDQQAQQQAAAEVQSAQRQKLATALRERVAQLKDSAAALPTKVAGPDLPETIESRLTSVSTQLDESKELLLELEQASGESWEDVRSRLEAKLGELRPVYDRASEEVAEWQRREEEALAARGEGQSPVNPKTGLIEGLDGGDYERYRVSVVKRVQLRLRREGIYAGPVDGYFDVTTMKAIGRFQEENALQVSGVPSPMTRSRLFADRA